MWRNTAIANVGSLQNSDLYFHQPHFTFFYVLYFFYIRVNYVHFGMDCFLAEVVMSSEHCLVCNTKCIIDSLLIEAVFLPNISEIW